MRRKLNIKSFEYYNSIVIDLPFGLGDQIMCFPLFASIKKAHLCSRITVLSPNRNSTLILSKNKFIDDVYEYGIKKFTYTEIIKFLVKDFLKLRMFFKKNNFDLFIVVHPNLFRTLLLKLLPYKNSIINTEQTHKTKESVNILNKLGIKPVYDYSIDVPQQKDILLQHSVKSKDYILVDLYAQHLDKDPRQWPYFEELISGLKKRKKNIVVAGLNPVHKKRTDISDTVNNTSLEELLVLIKNASLVISMDTGLFHFAYSLKTPVIGIFGPVNPKDRIPFDNSLDVKVVYSNKECSPCIKNKVTIDCGNEFQEYECMKDIKVDEVLKLIP